MLLREALMHRVVHVDKKTEVARHAMSWRVPG